MLLLVGSLTSTARADESQASVAFACKTFTFTFTGFPNVAKNRVTMWTRVDGALSSPVTYFFDGSTGSYTWVMNLPPGRHFVDGRTNWKTHNVKGGIDRSAVVNCGVETEFSITKLQKKHGGSEAFTTGQLFNKPHELGQIDYEIVVKNNGNVPQTFSNFTDPKCDEGTITGGPGNNPVAVGATTTFFCDHVLTEADAEAGFYTNSAKVTGEPAGGPSKEQESNTVELLLPPPEPGFSIVKKQKLEAMTTPKIPASGPYTTEVLKQGHVGQVVSYEIVVVNTGNVPLSFGPPVIRNAMKARSQAARAHPKSSPANQRRGTAGTP
jgi:hypothetical protein